MHDNCRVIRGVLMMCAMVLVPMVHTLLGSSTPYELEAEPRSRDLGVA